MNRGLTACIVSTVDGEEVKVSRDRLLDLGDMTDREIEREGIIPESVRDEYHRHFGG